MGWETIRDYIISNENIYLAIYCLDSYVFNPELLDDKDKQNLNELKDKFAYDLLLKEGEGIIYKVRKRIIKLLDDPNDFVDTKVYFRPKKYDEIKNKIISRPLHTAGIIDQIALVSLLNIFIYDYPKKNTKLSLSNLSKLIPSNFYGNRVSLKPEELFKPWAGQYKEYNQEATKKFKQYHETQEYTHEVKLDLVNFFPSINPSILFGYILDKLPVTFETDELKTISHALVKLLFCRVTNLKTENDRLKYYGRETDRETYFTLGIPQGLPQSYFLGNICMIEIANVFNSVFKGVSLYYVDDSVIFTKGLTNKCFEENLKTINNKIIDIIENGNLSVKRYVDEQDFLRLNYVVIRDFLLEFQESFNIKVHDENGKSTYSEIATASAGEIYLKQVSREVSQIGFDINTIYSDEEDIIVKNRISVLVDAISKEKKEVEKKLELKNIDTVKKEELCAYRDKLVRYFKYFSYRKLKLDMKEIRNIKEVLPEILIQNISEQKFIEIYKEGIWEAALAIYINNCEDKEEKEEIRRYIINLNQQILGFSNTETSYIYQVNKSFLEGKEKQNYIVDRYSTLIQLANLKLQKLSRKHTDITNSLLDEFLNSKSLYILEGNKDILPEELIVTMGLVDANTDEIRRMVLNARFSKILNVEISDNFVIEKQIKKPLLYGELRLLIFLRNRNFTLAKLESMKFDLSVKENLLKIDYTILEVLDCFKTFISDPIKIDFLIRVHQYTCDVWKNGSKYLYFYTLHNQDHAVDLIKNIIKIVKAISFFQISANDYYVLFIACYLHDISMVKIPSSELFLLNDRKADLIAYNFIEDLQKCINEKTLDNINIIKGLLEKYHKSIDEFFEVNIRNKHAKDSAKEIRNREDLNFLDICLREMIAQVAEGHGQNAEDVYYVRSNATESLVSLKFDKILLRLADLLDMSSYRVSKPILNHNIDQMSKESAFHWISHLITNRYELETQYIISEDSQNKGEFLAEGNITEVLVLRVYVEFNQLSGITNNKKCSKISLESIDEDTQFLELLCGKECCAKKCNFLCKWFINKNDFLIEELDEMKSYLNRTPNTFYKSDIKVYLCIEENPQTNLTPQQFEIIKEKIE